MARPLVEVQGMQFLQKQLTDFLPRESSAILRRTVTKIAARVRNDMKANAPKDTGRLRKAIRSRRERGERDLALAVVLITKGRDARYDAWYWFLVEFGTQNRSARPFVTPAFERAVGDHPRVFRNEFGRQIEKQMEKRAKKQRKPQVSRTTSFT